MAVDVSVRPATADDADAIRRVARDAWHAAYDPVIGPDRVDETVDSWYDPERLVADDVQPAVFRRGRRPDRRRLRRGRSRRD